MSVKDDSLEIMDCAGEAIAIHEIIKEKGKLVKLDSHRCDKRSRVDAQLSKTVASLVYSPLVLIAELFPYFHINKIVIHSDQPKTERSRSSRLF